MNPNQTARATIILVPIDDTPASAMAIETATAFAARFDPVELHFVHVVGPMLNVGGLEAVVDPTLGELLRASRELLAATRERFPSLPITTHTLVGAPAAEVVGLAKELDADLIIVGSHSRRSLERWLLGSVSEGIVRKAGCAVIVARPKDHGIVAPPEVEPPCPDCVSVQKASAGNQQWCARHAERHARARLHYETPPTFGVGSMLLRPEQ